MRKRGLFIVMGMILAITLNGCGSSNSEPTKQPVSVSEKSKDTTQAETEVEKEESKMKETEAETTTAPKEEISLPEQEIYNQDGLLVKVTGFNTDGSWGPEVKLFFENTGDKNVTIQPRNCSINGYMMDFQMSCDVAAGKKANDEMNISTRDLEQCGIETISDIEFSLHIFDTDNYDGITDSDIIQLKTTGSENYTQTYDDSGDILYDANNIKIVSKGLVESDYSIGPEFYMYIENNSDSGITIQVRNTSVNGFMIDASMSCDILPGKKAVDNMTFFSSDIESNGIEEIEDIETSFHIFSLEGYDTIADSEPIVISFK